MLTSEWMLFLELCLCDKEKFYVTELYGICEWLYISLSTNRLDKKKIDKSYMNFYEKTCKQDFLCDRPHINTFGIS